MARLVVALAVVRTTAKVLEIGIRIVYDFLFFLNNAILIDLNDVLVHVEHFVPRRLGVWRIVRFGWGWGVVCGVRDTFAGTLARLTRQDGASY